MSSYRLPDSFCVKAPLPALIFSIAIAIIVPPIPLTILAFSPEIDRTVLRDSAIIIPPSMLLFICFIAGRGYFRARGALRGLRIVLERDALTRVMPGLADLTIFQDEVVLIVETPGHGVAVFPQDRWKAIVVPSRLVGYEEVRETLSGWTEINVKPKPQMVIAAIIVCAVILLIAWFAAFIPETPYLTIPCGSAVVMFLSYLIYCIQRSPNFDKRTKHFAWGLILSIIPILLKLAMDCGLIPQL